LEEQWTKLSTPVFEFWFSHLLLVQWQKLTKYPLSSGSCVGEGKHKYNLSKPQENRKDSILDVEIFWILDFFQFLEHLHIFNGYLGEET
jgi:hypothetical protein